MTEARAQTAREINDTIRYTVWTVFSRNTRQPTLPGQSETDLQAWIDRLHDEDVDVRGAYDVSGMRAHADIMLWLHGPTAEGLQHALRDFRRDVLMGAVDIEWSAMGLHRPAEFNRGHVPAFMAGKPAQEWLSVYPFVRSYEWYLLPEEDRRTMLVEHGMKGRDYESVLSNTVSAFALNDYEWILALESPVLHDLVDMMRTMRYTEARRHVREEIPFYTGRRIDPAGVIDILR